MAVLQNQIGARTSTGTIWMNTGNTTGVNFSLTTSYAEVASLSTSFTLMSNSPDFAMTTDGRLKYTGINTKTFYTEASILVQSGGNVAFAIYKNGSLITGGDSYANAAALFFIPNVFISLATNDYLSIFGKASANVSRTIYQASLTAWSLQ